MTCSANEPVCSHDLFARHYIGGKRLRLKGSCKEFQIEPLKSGLHSQSLKSCPVN